MAFRSPSRRYLSRLHSPLHSAERLRVERVLCAARVFVTATAMLAVHLDPTEPPRFANLIYFLLGAYATYSIVLWIWTGRQTRITGVPWIHAIDILVPAAFMLFSHGPNSPFFVFFVFTLTAAAFRWGFPETLATAGCLVLLISVQAALLTFQPFRWLEGAYEVNRFVIRLSYLVGFAVLLGYLGEELKEWRAESDTVTRVMAKAQVENGLRGSIQAILGECLRLFAARRALVVVQQTATERVFLWRSEPGPEDGNTTVNEEVAPENRARYTAPLPVKALFARRREAQGWAMWGLSAEGVRERVPPEFNPADLPEAGHAGSLLAVSLRVGEDWVGHCLLFDAHTGPAVYKELRFAQKLLRRVAPACYTVYLLRRLRQRAGAMERARVARELHDGAIQALVAVEMDVDVLRRRVENQGVPSDLSSRLQRVQSMLREEVLGLRTLMQQMKPVEVSPGQLLEYIAEQVERFRRDTGINAQFVSGLEEVTASSRTCREIVRIVQEALVNVRKHSGARNVLLRLGGEHAAWKLVIEDDGCGFDFSGTLDLAALDAGRRGPEVIKERVRMLGGTLRLHSDPGQGCQLEITLPQKAHVAYV